VAGGWPEVTGRITGLETEFGVILAGGGLTPEEVARELFQPVVEWGRSTSVFTPAGGRLYLDVGSHPEYATPECASLSELVAHDLAGRAIMSGLADQASQALQAKGIDGTVYLIANNNDSAGNSFGCHENYLVQRQGADQAARALIPFLVARQILISKGFVQVGAKGARFVLSQRADHVHEATSSATTRARPMINTRDEPHADGALARRLHVIVGDTSVCPVTTRLKVGATDLVLRALEQGVPSPGFELASPINAIRQIAHGFVNQRPVKLNDGRSITAVDLQAEYLALAETVATEGDEMVIDLWRRAIVAWQLLNFEPVATELDWVIKHRLITRYQNRGGMSLLDPRIARLELAYHDVGPGGLAGRLQAAGAMAQAIAPEAVAQAALTPPSGSRAQVRGALISAARAAGLDYSVDWTTFKLANGQAGTIKVMDPRGQDAAAAWELVADLQTQSVATSKLQLDAILEQAATVNST